MTETRTAMLGRSLCLGGASLGAIVLAGWFSGTASEVTFAPGRPAMAPDAGFALLLLGLAGALINSNQVSRAHRLFAGLMGAVVIAIGVEIAVKYALGTRFPIDHFIFHNPAMPYPWRRSPPTAAAFICLGAVILLFDLRPEKRARASEWLILCSSLIAITALLGYLYGADTYNPVSGALIVGRPVPVAAIKALRFSAERLMLDVSVPGALGVLMICAGLLLGPSNSAIVRSFMAPGPGGALLKRLAPVAIVIPILLGFLAARFGGLEDVPLAFAALTAITMLASLHFLGVTATHLNRANEALENAHKRARDFINSASDCILIADIEGRVQEVNEAGRRLFGYSREEMLTRKYSDLIPPEDAERLLSHRAELLAGRTDLGEWTIVRKDRVRLPAEISAKILPDGRWQGIVRDISERKRAESALREAHERLELALSGGDLATWDWNVKTGEVIYNRRWADLRGIRPQQFISNFQAWSKGIHPEDWPRVQKSISDCLELNHSDFECEYRVAAKSGEWIWVLNRGKVFERDKLGKPLRMAGTELDLTARKRAEQQLARDFDAMKRLQKLGAVSAQAGKLEPVLTEIVDAAIAISGSDFGNIQLLDPVSGDLRIAAQRNFPSWWVEFWNSVSMGRSLRDGACSW